jgi:hypothetical protein
MKCIQLRSRFDGDIAEPTLEAGNFCMKNIYKPTTTNMETVSNFELCPINLT